ncbi:MAG TPA: PQQ-binding-like beta-propeller repeat protein [Methylomirabilota bacterium]|nr:PQQ-binding-like beta-propeller repeat protein [Methylomirabilota bacterium]
MNYGAMRHSILALLSATAVAIHVPMLPAANWPQWRGPAFDGSSPESDVPAAFSKTEHVKWAADLPGPAAATPVVWGDHVFVSSTDRQARSILAMALDRKTGKLLWKHEVAPAFGQDDRSNYASPSPATDGQRVVFFYGTGDLVAFDFAGQKLWSRNLQKDYGPFAFLWTFSSSPLLHDGRLYMQVLQRDVPVNGRGRSDGPNESYLLALDPKSGKELWKHIRPSEARQESLEAFSTPVPAQLAGRQEILIAGGDCISGHDPVTGKELWRWGTWNPTRITHWRLVPSPVAGGNVALACGPKGAPVFAVKGGQNGAFTNDSALAWTTREHRDVSADVSTPLFYKGWFYVLNSDKRNLSRIDPATGRIHWTGAIDSRAKIEASPTAAGDKIYVMNHRGDVFVMAAGDEFKVLHTAAMGDEGDKDLRSSIAISQGQLFIRTGTRLYCIGK